MGHGTEGRTAYDASDMELLFSRGHWRGWGEAIHWLQAEGMDDGDLTPSRAQHLAEDLACLDRRDVGFVTDPMEAFSLASEH